MSLMPPHGPGRPWLPWRSTWLAGGVLTATLVAGVPLFLRMPPWCDLTLYDLAARNLLTGGVHYRDVFDTNLPGFVWALAALRAVLGWGYEALRAVDLLIVGGVVVLLDRLAARAGAPRGARAWAAAGAAVFYPFTTEFNHCQRDVWMMLPALTAALLRCRRLLPALFPSGGGAEGVCGVPPTPVPGAASGDHNTDLGDAPRSCVSCPASLECRVFLPVLLEGVLWALAVWIKPHVVVPAAALWLVTGPRAWAAGGRCGFLADLFGNVLGGLGVGVVGVTYLAATGTWPWFIEAFTFWNTGYAALMWTELPARYGLQLRYFPPWSCLQVVSLPVAVLSVVDARPWSTRPHGANALGPVGRRLPLWLWDPGTDAGVRFARLVLATVYLGWTTQGLFLQRQFHYVHVPETLILLWVLASQRWAAGSLVTGWLAATSGLILLGFAHPPAPSVTGTAARRSGLMILHPAADPDRMRLWTDCWRIGLSDRDYRRRMTAVGLVKDFHAANDWVQLGEVGDWLASRGVRDGEMLCWHDAPHAVYLQLGVRPGFRFQHVIQMMGIGPAQERRVQDELCAAAPRVRYVVSDLMRVGAERPELVGDPAGCGPDLLPPGLAPEVRDGFPWDQPAAFRSAGGSGRYVVQELRNPIGWCRQCEE